MEKIRYSQEDLNEMRKMKQEGATYKEIADMFGRTKEAIATKFKELGWQDARETVRVVTRKASLDDFSPREMIKYLYEMGYRIEGGKLVFIQRTEVKLSDILCSS